MTDLAQQARERSPFDIYSASFFPREHALHCFACGGAIGTTTCNCASYNLSRDFLASALEWARLDALAFRDAQPEEGAKADTRLDTAEHIGWWSHGDSHFWQWLADQRVKPSTIDLLQRGIAALAKPRPDRDPDESLPGHYPLREALIMAAQLVPGVTRTGSEAERIADAALPLFEGEVVVRPDREAVALADRLEDLGKRATKRPWRRFTSVHGNDVLAIMKGDRPDEGRWPQIVTWAGFDGTDVPKRFNVPNLELMVELANALPQIVAALRAQSLPAEPVQEMREGWSDLPDRFEAWWLDYQHGGSEPAGYGEKKQIAFDAFSAAQAKPSAAMPPSDGGAREERERLLKVLKFAHAEAKTANHVISLNRDGQGQGRIRVATAMHRIQHRIEEYLVALAEPEERGEGK